MTTAATSTRQEPPNQGLFGEADLSQERLFRRNLGFLIASTACMVGGGVLTLTTDSGGWADVARWFGLAGLALGYPMYWIALKAVVTSRNKLTTEVFITIALVAVVYEGLYWYASWVVFILWVGEALMAWAGRHARSAVEALIRLVPRQARLATADGRQVLVPVEQVRPGTVVVVYPGERIPVDGTVVSGETTVDESMLTGEAVPAERAAGEDVFAGTYNLQGAVRVRTTKPTDQNTVARIVALMRQAQREHVPAKRTVDLFLRWFLPFVLVAAAVAGFLTGSLERVATILLVITPCAFAASTPLAIIATIGNAARRGIVIKGASCIEACSRATVVLLDKTGTLTTATPGLAVVVPFDRPEAEVLQLAAIAEKQSHHPLARAVCAAAEQRGIPVPDPGQFGVHAGHGIVASYDGRTFAVGSERFLHQTGAEVPEPVRQRAATLEEEGFSTAYVLENGVVIGLLGFLAALREDAAAVIAGLRGLGIDHLVMVTGDRSAPARAIAGQLGIGHRAQATPEAKLAEVHRWQHEGHTVAMVGDGINDATALAAADVGIAMVGAGSEVSALAADVVVHGDSLSRVLAVTRLARRGIATIRLNIAFATGYNLVGLALALAGLISPGVAVLFHAASFISVVLNSAAVLRYNPRVPGANPRVPGAVGA